MAWTSSSQNLIDSARCALSVCRIQIMHSDGFYQLSATPSHPTLSLYLQTVPASLHCPCIPTLSMHPWTVCPCIPAPSVPAIPALSLHPCSVCPCIPSILLLPAQGWGLLPGIGLRKTLELTNPQYGSNKSKLLPHLEKSVWLPKKEGKVNCLIESSSNHIFVP